jgi:hypothetical protein
VAEVPASVSNRVLEINRREQATPEDVKTLPEIRGCVPPCGGRLQPIIPPSSLVIGLSRHFDSPGGRVDGERPQSNGLVLSGKGHPRPVEGAAGVRRRPAGSRGREA